MHIRQNFNIAIFLSVLPLWIGLTALIGWIGDIETLKRMSTAKVAMNPATAICFFLLGLEMARLTSKTASPLLQKAGTIAVLAVGLIASLKLSDLGFGTNFHPDTLLFHLKLLNEPGMPNTMAPNTAFNFLMMSIAILMLRTYNEKFIMAAQIVVIIPALVAMLALTGYAYEIKSLYGIGAYIPMALNTALSFVLMSFAVLLAIPHHGYMNYIINTGPSGTMASFLLPASLVIPFALGWCSLQGQREGLYDPEFGIALFVILDMLMLSALTCISAKLVFATDYDRQLAETELRYNATHDALTGLLNRRSFMTAVEQRSAIANRYADRTYPFAVMFLDLDGFKQINDMMGHDAGDQCLKTFAKVLHECTRSADTVARFGGDEFVILLNKIRGDKDAVSCAERILQTLPKGFYYKGVETPIGVSIGIAVSYANARCPEDLLKAADEALYQAKAAGKGQYKMTIHEPETPSEKKH